MRNLASLAILGIFVALQTGCAAGVAVTRPRLPTIIIGEAPAEPQVVRHPPVRHQPVYQPLSRGEAIALGQDWCNANGIGCRLNEAKLKRNDGVWKMKFETARAHNGRGRGHYEGNGRGRGPKNGKLHMEIDAYTGRLLDVDARRS